MKVLFILAALILPLVIGQSVTTSYPTACYSTCASCVGFPSNCTSCHSTLVLVDGQCILDVRDGLLVNQFFPLTQTANANISTAPLLDTTTFSVGSCSYTQSGSVLSTMTFIVPTNGQPLTLAYGPAVVPPHSYLNIRMVIMQRAWAAGDRLDITFNANPTVQVNMGSPGASQIVCAGVQAYTTTLQYAFTDTSPSFNLVFNASFANNAASNYGINSLMIRYGNCHPSCAVCFGPFNTNCTSCQGYTLYNAATTTCYGCGTGFYAVNNSCYPCDPSCLTCSGGGSDSCTSCNSLFGTLTNGRCSLSDTNQNIQFSEFTTNSFNSSDGWTISTAGTGQHVISQCGIESYLGGYPISTSNSFISKYFNLEPHFGVAIFFNLLIVDSTLATVAANYWIDDTIYSITLNPSSGTNECGTTIPQSLTSVSTGFQPHNKSILYFQFRPLISSTSYYGIRNFFVIVQGCAPGCASCNQANSSFCSSCKSNYILQNGLCTNCPDGYFNNGSGCNICSSFCLTCTGPLMNQCLTCQSPFILKENLCTLQPGYGLYSMYLNSANSPINADNSWNIYPNLQTKGSTTCGGTNIFGSDKVLYKTLVLEKTFQNLPSHTQLTLHMNLYQIDDYNNETLTIYYDDIPHSYDPVTYGNNICGNSSTDAVVKVHQTLPHTGKTFKLKLILNQKAKVGINNLMIFLQGCASCNNDFGYKIRAIPRYNRNVANNGIDVWAQFNQGFYNSSPYDRNHFKGALGPMLNVGLNGRLLQNTVPLDFNVLSTYNDIRMFTQPSASSLNQPLNMMATSPAHFTTYPGGAGIPLLNNGASYPLVRYDMLQPGSGTQRAVRNLYNLFYGFTSAILYISICAFFFGLGGAFQQFVMILQIIFYHVFIMTDRMSLTLKVPLSGMQQIQFLNYFTDSVQRSIENWLLPTGFWCKSPHVFQQYQIDINFVRAIYAIVILILFYIVIYILMKILFYSTSRSLSLTKNAYINYFRQVYERPVSYFDQLLRYVFITTIWACLLQFTHLTNSFVPFSGLNAWATIMFFIIAMIYPAALCCYIWRQYVYMTNDQFNYLYNDVMFKRMRNQTPEQNPHPFIYIATRFYILFLVLLVIAIPAYRYNPLGSLIPLIIIHAADMIYVICVRIYADPFLLAFKIIENSCLIILQILMLAMYGRGRNMGQSSFYSLGYACVAFIIMMFVNASVRLIYLIYTRVMVFLQTKYRLDMQVLEQNRMNQAQKKLLIGRTRLFNNQSGQTQIIQQRNMTRRLPTHIVQQQMVQQMHRGSLMQPQPSIGRIIY